MLSRRLVFIGALWLASGAFLLSKSGRKRGSDAALNAARLGEYATRLGERQNVKIGFGDPETFYVPPYRPAVAQVQGTIFERVDLGAVPDSLRGIARAFDAYPDKCLGRIIKAIFIVGSVRFDDTEAEGGGTYGPDWIFLAAPRDASPGSRALTAEFGVHHETSSFLWLRDPELRKAFRDLQPADWHWATNTTDELAGADAAAPPLETGFLSAYGATTDENDFNIYAETVFFNPARLKNLAGRLPLIARKLALVLDAYIRVDERLRDTFSRNGLLQVARR